MAISYIREDRTKFRYKDISDQDGIIGLLWGDRVDIIREHGNEAIIKAHGKEGIVDHDVLAGDSLLER